ncbi:hypothetical protein K493DRAFT_412699 [Basidiobolus meristosporus CBS 931.73]|uniref:BHLH domain-containing protein n=1 Tax=Basidiobolus meristosporus CBS 931.73 TaxID=1314790 RepID=A0A1Y1WBU5_9FUNG|nr:hypothetical protein K493DRAFT_412699 [Basidiobolus meristosporus CBS 931.73]|eukprot:ORX71021.1 hypothetical protein K493DRAFT_412699 [Basidiobolus meristosporus CBS 931.73]
MEYSLPFYLTTADPITSLGYASRPFDIQLGHQLGLTEEDLATLPSSPSLRSATNPNTKLFDETEQRFFDNFLDNIFFEENLFTENPLPPTLDNAHYFTPGPSTSHPHTFPMEKSQHKSAVHSSLYDMLHQHSREPSMHGTPTPAPTTPSSLFMNHHSGMPSPVDSHTLQALTPTNIHSPPPKPIKRSSSIALPLHINTDIANQISPIIPAKRKGSDIKPRKYSMKKEHETSKPIREAGPESRSSMNNDSNQETGQNSQSPTPSAMDQPKEDTPKSDRSRKGNKELLTEEEKRANHIASEQKRRNMIRSGFRDLTEIVPSLRDMNNSKSTILFKAVDFIKRLERKNQRLKNKANTLQRRLEGAQNGGMYTLHNGHQPHQHQPPPPRPVAGEANPVPGAHGYMYGFNFGTNPAYDGGNGRYFGGGIPEDSVHQYPARPIVPSLNAASSCRVNVPAGAAPQESTADGSRRPAASRS